jgi:AcrR family transcriptional regulator
MPRTPEANQRIREAQRARILESARSVFARKGMEATITDIAAEAQISLGLAYRYFADKDAIFNELVRELVPADLSGFQRLMEMPGTPGKRLARLISGIVISRGQRERLETYQILHHALDTGTMPGDMRERLGKRYRMLLDTMRQLIVEGQATGEVAPGDPDQLVAIVNACIDGLTRWAIRDLEQFRAYVPDAEIVLRLLRPTDSNLAEDARPDDPDADSPIPLWEMVDYMIENE